MIKEFLPHSSKIAIYNLNQYPPRTHRYPKQIWNLPAGCELLTELFLGFSICAFAMVKQQINNESERFFSYCKILCCKTNQAGQANQSLKKMILLNAAKCQYIKKNQTSEGKSRI